MADSRLLHTATLLQDGRVLTVGGYRRLAEIYDPATGTWSRTADALKSRIAATATLLADGKVLLAGVSGSEWQGGNSAELYDPATGAWTAIGAMVTPRRYHAAILLADGRVLVMGGENGAAAGRVLATAEVYNPASGAWSQTGSMGAARRNHTATLLADGRVLVAGGTGASGALQSTAEVYDPTTGTWSQVGAMSIARTYHTATRLPGGQVLVVGGGGPTWNGGASAELYDPVSGLWSATSSLATPRRSHSATLLPTHKVLVVGGYHEYTGILTSAEIYDPATGSWCNAGNMAADRYQHTATLMGDQVLIAGGFSNTDQASAEVFTFFFNPEPGAPVGEPREPQGTSLLVQVVNAQGTPVAGASVRLGEQEVTTDAQGNVLFEGLSAGAHVAQVRAPGFAPGTVAVELEPGVHGGATASLNPLSPPIAFNADSDATIVTEEVAVNIPAGALLDENGRPVTGTAEISFAPIDPTTDDIISAPGAFVGVSAATGEAVELESGFMAEISLTQNGRPLQLAPGATASVTFTLPPQFAATPGELIQAWWFDTEAGVWREDGFGFVEESPTEPGKLIWTVEVSHFTSWNCDRPWSTRSCANVLVTDQEGRPLGGRTITARGLSYNYRGASITQADGRACVPVMRGGTARISVGSEWAPLAWQNITPGNIASCGSSSCTPVELTVNVSCGAPGTTQACAYTGRASTLSVGACRSGYRVCDGFNWGPCTGQVTPTAEVCENTIDEDCDGLLNDGCPVCDEGSTQHCYTGPANTEGVGLCQGGIRNCVSGRWSVCTGQITPTASEICGNLQDDDCDGLTDEGCTCTPGETQSCYTGPAGTEGFGQCRPGVRTCFGTSQPLSPSSQFISAQAFWGACTGQVTPTAEVCDGLDNDCNGRSDDGNPGGGSACSTGQPGVCAQGTLTCGGGLLACRPNMPASPERCDGLDNDCDGVSDEGNPEGGASCNTGIPGICSAGSMTCQAGGLTCVQNRMPIPEDCNTSADDDCDGQVNEGCGSPGGTSYFTYSASDTNSATRNTYNHSVSVPGGRTIVIGTCGISGASASGDTYLRLYDPYGQEVAANDDACGSLASYLMYTVPAGAGGIYTIKAGCWSGGGCSGRVGYTY